MLPKTDKTFGLHPTLKQAIDRILLRMEAHGHPMRVIEGVRSAERQAELYASGRTKPGPWLTNADGKTKKSYHQAKADGWGYAADLAFAGPDPFSESHPWDIYGKEAKKEGLVWGGDWPKKDRPHVELHLPSKPN